MECKVVSRRYDISGNPLNVEHTMTVNTSKDDYLKGVVTTEDLKSKFESFWNAPQRDGSRIKVDSIDMIFSE